MYKYFRKSVIIVILAIVSVMLCGGICIAEERNTVINDYVYEYAENFIDDDQDIYIEAVIPIYDAVGNIIRCCFQYNDEEKPYMYIILDNKLVEGVSPLIEYGMGRFELYEESKFNKIIYINEFVYGYESNNVVVYDECSSMTKGEVRANYSQVVSDQIVYRSNSDEAVEGYLEGAINSSDIENAYYMDYFLNFTPFKQSDLASRTSIGKGICGATTAMNVLKYYKDTQKNNAAFDNIFIKTNGVADTKATYDKLRSYQTLAEGENPYNLPTQDIRKDALTDYIEENTNLNIFTHKYWFVTWELIYLDLMQQKLVDYRYNVDNDIGHCVLVVAAVVVNPNVYPDTKYLAVADTWSNQFRWLNYGYHDNIRCMSIKIYE